MIGEGRQCDPFSAQYERCWTNSSIVSKNKQVSRLFLPLLIARLILFNFWDKAKALNVVKARECVSPLPLISSCYSKETNRKVLTSSIPS